MKIKCWKKDCAYNIDGWCDMEHTTFLEIGDDLKCCDYEKVKAMTDKATHSGGKHE